MADSKEKKAATPPYVAYKTLKNFIEKFKQGVPGRIDRDVMGTMSGAAQSQVVTTLRYLKFISENGIPTETFKRYVMLEGEERKEAWKAALTVAYPFIFSGGFDFATATVSLLREAFEENTSATGETVDRCMSFLKDAAADAGLPVSRFLSEKKARTAGQKKPRNGQSRRAADELPKDPPGDSHTDRKHPRIAAQDSLLLWGLFERLPKPGSVWPQSARDRWTQTLNNVLSLEYKDQP